MTSAGGKTKSYKCLYSGIRTAVFSSAKRIDSASSDEVRSASPFQAGSVTELPPDDTSSSDRHSSDSDIVRRSSDVEAELLDDQLLNKDDGSVSDDAPNDDTLTNVYRPHRMSTYDILSFGIERVRPHRVSTYDLLSFGIESAASTSVATESPVPESKAPKPIVPSKHLRVPPVEPANCEIGNPAKWPLLTPTKPSQLVDANGVAKYPFTPYGQRIRPRPPVSPPKRNRWAGCDRFIPQRKLSMASAFQLGAQFDELTHLERHQRTRNISIDPFVTPGLAQRRSAARMMANANREAFERQMTHGRQTLEPSRRPAGPTSVFDMGNGATYQGPPHGPSDGRGGYSTRRSFAPVYIADYLHPDVSEVDAQAHIARIALALDMPLNKRLFEYGPRKADLIHNAVPRLHWQFGHKHPVFWRDGQWVEDALHREVAPVRNNKREIPVVPFRILDAPGLRDDYYVHILAYSPTAKVLAVALENTVFLWTDEGGAKIISHSTRVNDYVTSLTFSSTDGGNAILAIGRHWGRLTLISVLEPEARLERDLSHSVTALAFAPKAIYRYSEIFTERFVKTETLLLGNDDGKVQYFTLEWASKEDVEIHRTNCSLVFRTEIQTHNQKHNIVGLAWSHDCRQFATGDSEGFMCLHDVANVEMDRTRRWFQSSKPSKPANKSRPSRASRITSSATSEAIAELLYDNFDKISARLSDRMSSGSPMDIDPPQHDEKLSAGPSDGRSSRFLSKVEHRQYSSHILDDLDRPGPSRAARRTHSSRQSSIHVEPHPRSRVFSHGHPIVASSSSSAETQPASRNAHDRAGPSRPSRRTDSQRSSSRGTTVHAEPWRPMPARLRNAEWEAIMNSGQASMLESSVGTNRAGEDETFLTHRFAQGPTFRVPPRMEKWRSRIMAAVKAIAFCPWENNLLAVGGGAKDQSVYFYHTDSGSHLATIKVGAQVTCLVWSLTRKEIAVVLGYALPHHNHRIAVFSWPDCEQIATVPWRADMRAFDAIFFPGRPLDRDANQVREGSSWGYSEDGCVCVASNDGSIRFHEVFTREADADQKPKKGKRIGRKGKKPIGNYGSSLLDVLEGGEPDFGEHVIR